MIDVRFDLENAVREWKKEFRKQETLDDGALADMELLLRDAYHAQRRRGLDEDEAFRAAVALVGPASSIAFEYEKNRAVNINRRSPFRPTRFMPALVGNSLKVAWRRILRQKGYSFLNVAGTAAGLTCVILIALYVRHELSYDRYHPGADRIYRVASQSHIQGLGDSTRSPVALAPALAAEFPEIAAAARIMKSSEQFVRDAEKTEALRESRIYFADPEIFAVLSIPLAAGDPRTALAAPNSIVISARTAAKYWGGADPLNKTIVLTDTRPFGPSRAPVEATYRITGVFRDIPAHSHLQADFIGSLSSSADMRSPRWDFRVVMTYLKTRDGSDPRALQAKIDDYARRKAAEERGGEAASASLPTLFLQPIASIHLHSHLVGEAEPNGDAGTVALFSIVALLILIVAGVNYVNLATARAGLRAREVGIRKVVGSSRGRLVRQFLVESGLMTLAAFGLALVSAVLLLPYFRELTGREIRPAALLHPLFLVSLPIGILLFSLLAGIYPALVLSSPRPSDVLKRASEPGRRGRKLRAVLIVFQFAVGLILSISTLVIVKQMRYIRTADPGFDKEQVLLIHNGRILGPRISAFKEALAGDPNVSSVTAASNLPVPSFSYADGIILEGQAEASEPYVVDVFLVDTDYIRTMGMTLIQGRNFSKDLPTDRHTAIINEAMARRFGWTTPLGMRFRKTHDAHDGGESPLYTVVGVVKDFHYESFRNPIQPAVFYLEDDSGFVAARLRAKNVSSAVESVRRAWNGLAPGWPFEYSFMDERFDSLYKAELKTGRILAAFAILAGLISGLGLFGLAAFMAERRTREIGIRKVLGASVRESVVLLIKEFAVLVVLANLLAAPLAYVLNRKWLQGFAYRTNIGIDVFIAAGIFSLLLAVLTVSYQSLKAALADPVDSLKYE